MPAPSDIQTLFVTAGSWHLPQTARAFEQRGALAGLWMSDRNKGRVSAEKFNWCWPVFGLTKPLWFTPLPPYWSERLFWNSLPVWKAWLKCQRFPECNVVHARMGYGLEPFQRVGDKALKVVDCCNSHPVTQAGYWQRELELFAAGQRPVVPDFMFQRMTDELALADVILCPSDFVRETMLANDIPAEKCFVCPFGFDDQTFTPRKKFPENPRFVFTGIICLRKGIQYLLRAFAQVKKQLPNASLVLIGGINWEIKEELRKWGQPFEHIPYCPQDQLAAELRRATAFVFPSCEEGFARSIIEAMGCALPIIATHESGATTLIRDGDNGLIVRSRDVAGLAAAMCRVAEDASLNEKLGQTAYETVKHRTWQWYGDEILQHYQASIRRNI